MNRVLLLLFIAGLLFFSGCLSPPPSGCVEDWSCSAYGPCLNGTESRLCVDANFCGTTLAKPIESRACEGAGPLGTIRVVRDTWGVAHVFAETDEGAFFGWGYATAEDRMVQMEYVRSLMQGRIAEFIGARGTGSASTIEHDKQFRHAGYYSAAQEKAARLGPATRILLQSYADGVNAYLDAHALALDPLLEEKPAPWTIADILVSYDYMQLPGIDSQELANLRTLEQYTTQLGSLHAAILRMRSEFPVSITDDAAAVVQQSDVPLSTQHAMRAYAIAYPSYEQRVGLLEEPVSLPLAVTYKWSQGWAVGGDHSTTGNSILVGHPQITVTNPNLWHEIHIVGETFNARGIDRPGAPGFFVGFTPTLAWTMTAMGTDMSDLVTLKMIDSQTYEVDGVRYPIRSDTQIIAVKDGTPVSVTVRSTHLGPIVTPLLPNVQPGEEFVSRTILNWEKDHHTLESLIALMRTSDVDHVGEAIQYYRTPSVNGVFADSRGGVAYWALAGQITRSSNVPLAGLVATDGSQSRNDWVEVTPHTIRPHVLNPAAGIVYSANHLPVGSWYPIPDSYAGGEGARSWRLRELLLESGKARFTPFEVQAMYRDTVDPFTRTIVQAALHARNVQHIQFSEKAENVLNMMVGWYAQGASGKVQSASDILAQNVGAPFRFNVAGALIDRWGPSNPGLARFLKDVEARIAENPTRAAFDGPELAYLEASLSNGWDATLRTYGADSTRWVSKFNSEQSPLVAPFGDSLWEDYGSLDPSRDRTASGFTVDNGGLWGPRSQSYTQWVNFADVDSSQSLQPFSVGEDSQSVGYNAQYPLWINGQLHPAPLSEAKVATYKVLEYTIMP